MPSTVADFLTRARKDVVLPSGLTVRIRKIQSWDFMSLGDLPLPVASAPDDPTAAPSLERVKLLRQYMQRAIAAGAVEPRMTDDEAQHSDTCLYVGYMDATDAEALALEIMNWAGLTQDTAVAVDAFRVDEISASGEGIGGAVQRPALDRVGV